MGLLDMWFDFCAHLSGGQLAVVLILFAIVSFSLLFYLVYLFDKHCMQPNREIFNPYLKIEREKREKEQAERKKARQELREQMRKK